LNQFSHNIKITVELRNNWCSQWIAQDELDFHINNLNRARCIKNSVEEVQCSHNNHWPTILISETTTDSMS